MNILGSHSLLTAVLTCALVDFLIVRMIVKAPRPYFLRAVWVVLVLCLPFIGAIAAALVFRKDFRKTSGDDPGWY